MSWQISLVGKKSIVTAELTHAAMQLGNAVNALNSIGNDEVSVNVSGSAWMAANGEVGLGASFNATGLAPQQANLAQQDIFDDAKTE